jgi:hypothetical protein
LDKPIFVAILQKFDCQFSFTVSAAGTTETLQSNHILDEELVFI